MPTNSDTEHLHARITETNARIEALHTRVTNVESKFMDKLTSIDEKLTQLTVNTARAACPSPGACVGLKHDMEMLALQNEKDHTRIQTQCEAHRTENKERLRAHEEWQLRYEEEMAEIRENILEYRTGLKIFVYSLPLALTAIGLVISVFGPTLRALFGL